jgi:RNA polymerase sigma factor (sigma-70 family)
MNVPDIESHYVKNRDRIIKRVSFRIGNNFHGAEDIVQTAYERAIRYHRSFSGNLFDNWFSTILNNCLREYQNAERGYVQQDENEEDVGEGSECPSYPRYIMREVFELINTKSDAQMEVLNLFFKQEYTAVDISRITSIPYGRAHQIIQRFRNELKELYRE